MLAGEVPTWICCSEVHISDADIPKMKRFNVFQVVFGHINSNNCLKIGGFPSSWWNAS